jgi:adenylate kinase
MSQPLILNIIGAPGSGKGTQSKAIVDKYGVNRISPGDLIRELRVQDSRLGQRVKVNYDKGIPQPDDIVIDAIKNKLPSMDIKKGILFDPLLSVGQTEAVEKMMKDLGMPELWAIYLKVSPETVAKRVSSRLICSNPKCATIYLPADGSAYTDRVCSKCGGKLIQRPDDTPEIVVRRIKEYESRMQDLENYYKEKGRLIAINGEPAIEEISQDIFKHTDELRKE